MSFVEKAIVLYRAESETLLQAVQDFAGSHGIDVRALATDEFLADPHPHLRDRHHVVVIAAEGDVARVFICARELQFSVGILPGSTSSVLYRLFKIPRKLEQTLELAFCQSAEAVDLLLCNDEAVLGLVMLGETPFIDQRSKSYLVEDPNLVSAFWRSLMLLWVSLRKLFRIRHFLATVTTAKGNAIRTAVTGIVIIENDTYSAAAKLVDQTVSVRDGKVSALLISPKSIGEYLTFVVAAVFPKKTARPVLPAAVSYIKSSEIKIVSSGSMTYYLDGKRREAPEMVLRVVPKALQVNLSDLYRQEQTTPESSKETMKIEGLPTSSTRLAAITKRLPFFSRAMEEEFKDLFLVLKDNAQFKSDYVALIILSAIVATLGLFLDSAAVIIGAMVLAPLMAPIISLAMALLRSDGTLMRTSFLTIVYGALIALGTAALLAWIVPLQKMTGEISARLQPSILDLGVAVASGIAGGLAHARESIMKSLPGVAIAVALAPPLCVAGIGIGWLDLHIISGAMLLFLTNLVGITLAAALTFMVLGYGALNRVVTGLKGIGASLVVMLMVSVPLYLSFERIRDHWVLEHKLASELFTVNGKPVKLNNVQVNLQSEEIQIRANLLSSEPLAQEDVQALKQMFEAAWQKPVRMNVGYRLEF